MIQATLSSYDNILSVSELCRIANVSRSGYYRWAAAAESRARREAQEQNDFALILQAYNHRGYAKGARSIYMHLLHLETPVCMNLKKIRRIMNKYGLKCPIRKANPYRRMLNAVNQLIKIHGVSLQAETLINSDQGSHYTSLKFIQIIRDNHLRQSMSRKANCWDNALQESFFGHMKDELDLVACSVNAGIARAEDATRGLFLLDQVYELMYQIAKK
ncbi:hypothetical protein D1159_18625 [Pseudoflavonifractor sp. 524-17]|uniref:IS3 family transposase n=1 Tax=Pseudoflavonifractor sp. 524-17 TaxID=2304577 RepID=UPI001379A124|nr:IS3 family transposase [Pseudoflavonifractor sp. 524-17]NCE66516.1 hypothetical protein [Pseudoflavonifractor sp. 524-17]